MRKFTRRVSVTNVRSLTAGRDVYYVWTILIEEGNRVNMRKHKSKNGQAYYIDQWLMEMGYTPGVDALAECTEVLEC